jgi:hypothetical protein
VNYQQLLESLAEQLARLTRERAEALAVRPEKLQEINTEIDQLAATLGAVARAAKRDGGGT